MMPDLRSLLKRLTLAEIGKFLRFCVAGSAGFIVDSSVLLLMLTAFNAGPFWGRAVSALTAITTTWLINRTWTFKVRTRPNVREYLGYVGVQSAGLLCNLIVYTAMVLWMPPPLNSPFAALVVASAVALVLNYFGLRFRVFSRQQP